MNFRQVLIDPAKQTTKEGKMKKQDSFHETCKTELNRSHHLIHLNPRRIVLILFLFVLGLLSTRRILSPNNRLNEVDLLNDMIEKSKLAYTNSILYSRRNTNPQSRPGYLLREQGATASYPVVLIPGFITSGLELWDGEECARSYFRQRLWGSLPVFVQSFFTDNECWRRHLSLDPDTGMDPENIRLRAVQGFEAADYVMSTFWVWEKMIENLADVGYDASNMILMPYDWRLSFIALEERDGYLTKLKLNIEAMVKTSGKKVVLTSHSMGSQIVLFFFKWVTTSESNGGGGGGRDWVDKHIHSFVNIAGPILGVPKAVSALLSGEMKDTAAMMGTMGSLLEVIFGRSNRKKLWKTWGSLWAMLPKGGDAIWSNAGDIVNTQLNVNEKNVSTLLGTTSTTSSEEKCAIDDLTNQALITFDASDSTSDKIETWTVNDSIKYLQHWGGVLKNSVHAAQVHNFQSEGRVTREHWHDPTFTPLPNAPSMKIYCLYGVGIETERAYFYKRRENSSSIEDLPYLMDTTVNDPVNNIKFGTRFTDGDVSVPVVSLGYMCVDGWKNKALNPSGIDVVTREYLHQEEFNVNDPMRGGRHSADHVDILGNVDTTLDLLKIVTDFNVTTIENNIVSRIKEIAAKINLKRDNKNRSKRIFKFLPQHMFH